MKSIATILNDIRTIYLAQSNQSAAPHSAPSSAASTTTPSVVEDAQSENENDAVADRNPWFGGIFNFGAVSDEDDDVVAEDDGDNPFEEVGDVGAGFDVVDTGAGDGSLATNPALTRLHGFRSQRTALPPNNTCTLAAIVVGDSKRAMDEQRAFVARYTLHESNDARWQRSLPAREFLTLARLELQNLQFEEAHRTATLAIDIVLRRGVVDQQSLDNVESLLSIIRHCQAEKGQPDGDWRDNTSKFKETMQIFGNDFSFLDRR